MSKESWDLIKEILDDDFWDEDEGDERASDESNVAMPARDAMQAASGWRKITPDHNQPESEAESTNNYMEELAEAYDEDRESFRRAVDNFRTQLMYSFPDVNAMSSQDVSAALISVKKFQTYVLNCTIPALLNKAQGRKSYDEEVEAAQASLQLFTQTFTRRRERIEQIATDQKAQAEADRIASYRKIQAQREATERAAQERSRRLIKETNDEIFRMNAERMRKQKESNDRRNEEWLATMRGERIIGWFEVK